MNTATKPYRNAASYAPLTEQQCIALRAFARQYGPQWKTKLADLWYRAAAQPTLHSLRNSHGPAWLEAFHMEQPARLVAGSGVTVLKGSRALCIELRKGHPFVSVERVDGAVVYLRVREAKEDRVFGLRAKSEAALGDLTTTLSDPSGNSIVVEAWNCDAPRE